MTERVVIIGAGMAGTRLAAELSGFEVVLLGDENHYNRSRLTEYVAGRAAKPTTEPLEVASAVEVDRSARVVVDSLGRRWSYDHLVFATGAEPVVPAVVAGHQTLRTATDADAIVEAAGRVRRAVVLGGGVLGVETACALRERGVAVTLVHDGETLLDKAVRPTVGRSITRSVRELGIEVLLNAEVTGTTTRDGVFRALQLAGGRNVFGELLVVACGVKPRTGLAVAAKLRVNDGIVVDRTLTSPDDPRVHAIGDCAEIDGERSGTVTSAWEQASALAEQLRHGTQYEQTPEVVRLTAGGLDVLVIGGRDVEGEVVRLEDGKRYVRAVLREGIVVGAVTVGAPEVAAELVLLADRRTQVVGDVSADRADASEEEGVDRLQVQRSDQGRDRSGVARRCRQCGRHRGEDQGNDGLRQLYRCRRQPARPAPAR